MIELSFLLSIEDGWPPVATESLPCTKTETGFRIEVSPLFIADISAGDVLDVFRNGEGYVTAWKHLHKSQRTTLWLMGKKSLSPKIDSVLECLRGFQCNTARLPQFGVYSVDIPEECRISTVDECLKVLDESEVAITFASFRHEEDES